jgi:WhiB family redox-sensing transcriptional regulator
MDQHPKKAGKAANRQRARTVPAHLGVPIGDWIEVAACVAAEPEVFFTTGPESDAEAKRYCARCPVREECRDYALTAGEELGVWGGLNADERKNILGDADQGEQRDRLGGAA